MATVRIYRVAELLNTSSQEVMALLKRDHGIDVKSASSTIEEVVARQFVERLARQRNITVPSSASFADTPTAVRGRKPAPKTAEPQRPAAPALPPPRLVKTAKPAAPPPDAEAIEAPSARLRRADRSRGSACARANRQRYQNRWLSQSLLSSLNRLLSSRRRPSKSRSCRPSLRSRRAGCRSARGVRAARRRRGKPLHRLRRPVPP